MDTDNADQISHGYTRLERSRMDADNTDQIVTDKHGHTRIRLGTERTGNNRISRFDNEPG